MARYTFSENSKHRRVEIVLEVSLRDLGEAEVSLLPIPNLDYGNLPKLRIRAIVELEIAALNIKTEYHVERRLDGGDLWADMDAAMWINLNNPEEELAYFANQECIRHAFHQRMGVRQAHTLLEQARATLNIRMAALRLGVVKVSLTRVAKDEQPSEGEEADDDR